jgi:hypothetical protein
MLASHPTPRHRFATDGTWDDLLRVIQAEADAAGRPPRLD